jgi:hypothetical protein
MSIPDLRVSSSGVRPEIELLACCGRVQVADPVSRIAALLREEIDWTYLVRMTLAHGMSPFLARALDQVSTGIPREIQEALRDHLEDNRVRNRKLARVLVEVLDALEDQGVMAIPFKGPVLGAIAHGDFSLRRAGDLDILVRDDDVSTVCRTLAASGFREFTEYQTGRPLSAAEHAMHRRYQCEYAFIRESDGVVVEPHWAIAPAAVPVALDYSALWGRARPEPMFGRQILSLALEDLLVLLSIHGSKHEWAEIRWICDLAGLIERQPRIDLDAALARARDQGCGRMLLVGLGLSRRVLGTKLPPSILWHLDGDGTATALVKRITDRLFRGERVPDGVDRVSMFLIQVHERKLDRVRYVIRTLATPRIEHMRLVALPPWLWGLYVPLKLVYSCLLIPLWRGVKRARALAPSSALRQP